MVEQGHPPQTFVIDEGCPHPGSVKDTINPRIQEETLPSGPIETLKDVSIDDNEPTRVLKVGANLREDIVCDLTNFLKTNLVVFVWTHADMVGISLDVICHQLNIDPKAKPVRQKQRAMDPERYVALRDEVSKRMDINFIR